MKKFLNGLGVFGSVILTIILTILIFVYVLLVNIRSIVSEKGMAKTFKQINLVETIKTMEDGVMWEDFLQLADELDLTEAQFEGILNSDDVKEQIGGYIGEVLGSITSDKEVNLTRNDIEEFFDIAITEYNKVSDTKISDADKEEIILSFNDEMIENINQEFGSINLIDTVDPEYIQYVKLADNLLFGSYALILFVIILLVIGLIALMRYSLYKWIPYVKVSFIISGILLLIIGLLVLIVPLEDLEIIMPLRKILGTKIIISSVILVILSIGLTIGKKHIKKLIDNKSLGEMINKEKNEEKIEELKEEKKKIDKKTIIIIILLLLIIFLVIFFLLWGNRSYIVRFETNGGTQLTNIEVKNNGVVNLPESITKEGYIFAGWTNEEGKFLTNGTKIDDDMVIEANWISEDASIVNAEINIDDDLVSNIIFEKGKNLILPEDPYKKGYIFGGWFDDKDNLLTDNIILTEDIYIYAKWIKKGDKTSTIKFDTDGGNKIENIVVENGKIIVFPVDPTKEGYTFAGWVDEKGNLIKSDTIVKDDITIKAKWTSGYSCPSGCTPIGDGSKCTKTTTKDVVSYTGCPSGTETIETFCSSHKRQISMGFGEDMTYETVGIICDGNPSGFCVDYNNRYTISSDSCPSGYYKYTEVEGFGAVYGCAKKYDKGGSGCPNGYNKDGNKCVKTETITCTKN